MSTARDLLPVAIEIVGATLPGGFDSWGIKSVRSNRTTTHDFAWAVPGGLSRSDNRVDQDNAGACPSRPGDGLCIATTWYGMASGGIPARYLILVAYRSDNVLGRNDACGKLRVSGDVAVVADVDGWRLVRDHGSGADLTFADLTFADLTAADLTGAMTDWDLSA